MLQPGTRLGPYSVGAPLGSGGMGEVYRAEDTRLHRAVAIKILSDPVGRNPEAARRFEREARAAAALNHPNICTIYDVGTDPPFIAMELLEGETLQQRISRGALDVPAAVEITLGLVDALGLAHSKGILHRDIKPANIFLTERGPKILDFGVAKALPSPHVAAVGDDTHEATRAAESVLTGEGTTVGTVAYMSPEQLRGRPLDGRSDLFSLGLVMYEMVTGRPAFSGETSAVVAAAILQEAPVLPHDIRADVPPRLEEIILKTLEKDPADRTQTAGELRADLRRFNRESSSGSGAGYGSSGSRRTAPSSGARLGTGPASGMRSQIGRRAAILAALVAVAVLAALAFLAWPWIAGQNDGGVSPLLDNLQVSQVTVSGKAWRPALSPDGKYVVYIQRDGVERSVRLRQLGTDRDVEIVPAQPGLFIHSATVTPDGSFIDFVRGPTQDTTLWRVPFLGGSPRRLIDEVDSPIGWSPDGSQMAFVRAGFDGASALVIADAEGGNQRTVATRPLPGQLLSFGSRGTPSGQGASIPPAWSPDGKTLAMIGFQQTGGVLTRHAVFVDVASGGERTIVLRDESGADGLDWLDSGHLVASLSGTNDAVSQLWLLSYPAGMWSRLTNDLSNYASFSVSRDRRAIAVARWDHRIGISVLEQGSRDPVDRVPAGPFVGEDIAWAGDTLLYAVLSPADNLPAIWALRNGESAPQELVANSYSPAASRDGQTIVFSRFEKGRRGIWRADREGRNAVEVGTSASNRVSVTPDGRQALYLSLESGVQSVWRLPLAGGAATEVTKTYAFQPVPSPDGKSVAFVSLDEQKRSVISICALSDCSSKRNLLIPRRPTAIQWAPDGRGVAYAMRSNIWLLPLDGTPASRLTQFPEDDHQIEDFEWSPDAKRLAISRSRTAWDIVLFKHEETKATKGKHEETKTTR